VVLARLAEVDRERHHFRLVGVLDPLQHHAGVEATRVEQQHPIHLGRVCLIACGRTLLRRISARHSVPSPPPSVPSSSVGNSSSSKICPSSAASASSISCSSSSS